MDYHPYARKVAMSQRERKHLPFELKLKAIEADGRFAGYASVFDVVDTQRDTMQRGAFLRTIKGRVREIKLLWQHEMGEPIGYCTRLMEDSRGLYVEGQLMLSLEKAREAYALLKEGVVSGLSIGYSPTRYRMNPDTGVRELLEVDLFEISLVTFPANTSSRVSVVKSASQRTATGRTQLCNALDAALLAILRT